MSSRLQSQTSSMSSSITHLQYLESEAIYILRETAAQFGKPAMLFSGGKDSIVMAWLARKAFHPAHLPFPLVHIDTGHNFPEAIEYRDWFVNEIKATLVVGSVQKSIDEGRAVEEKGHNASRNKLQTVTLLDTIEAHEYDACLGGGRVMKRRPAPRSASSPIAMSLASGTPRTSALSSGTSSTAARTMASTSACSR